MITYVFLKIVINNVRTLNFEMKAILLFKRALNISKNKSIIIVCEVKIEFLCSTLNKT